MYHVLRNLTKDNAWERLNDRLRALVRKAAGKDCRPTAAILDRQSVKSPPRGGAVGYDAAKNIKRRKRHLLVDTMGLVLGVLVAPANVAERDGARTLLGWSTWLRKLCVDGGYTGNAFAQ